MDCSGQDSDAAAGEQPHLPPVDTPVHAIWGHVLFDSIAAGANDIFRHAPDDCPYQDIIRAAELASWGGEATRTAGAAASRGTDASGQNNDGDAGEQPHPLTAGTPVLVPWHESLFLMDVLRRRIGHGDGDEDGDMNWYEDDDAYRGGGFGAVPASDDEIARLEKAAVGDTRETECAVCMERFGEGDEIRKMPCSHVFHQTCIFKWLRVSRLCPHCRFAMRAGDK
jgi:hypothetical protein